MKRAPLICLLTIFAVVHSQGIGVEEFTKSPSEHIITEIGKPFVVRSVAGVIRRAQGDGGCLSNVIFEIKGPGANDRVWRATTDQNGRFKIKHVPEGEYRFKATLDGFQSLTGKIVVSNAASIAEKIEIDLRVGI